MAIPRILKNWQAFVNGVGYAGLLPKFEAPEVSRKMEAHRAGGMDGEFEMDMGMEAMTAKLTMDEPIADIISAFADGGGRVQVRGSFVRDNDGSRVAVVQEIGGRWKKINLGDWEAGSKAPIEEEVAVDYYRVNIGGTDVIEIDVVNMIRIIGGVDELEGLRADIGA